MVAVLGAALFFVRWPYLPVEPKTVPGRAYYLCDSEMLRELGGTAFDRGGVTTKAMMKDGARRYALREIVGVSGTRRVAIDYAEPADRSRARPFIVGNCTTKLRCMRCQITGLKHVVASRVVAAFMLFSSTRRSAPFLTLLHSAVCQTPLGPLVGLVGASV